jgi:hypothetical protein
LAQVLDLWTLEAKTLQLIFGVEGLALLDLYLFRVDALIL